MAWKKIYSVFPYGKCKALTLSYDDGNINDIRLSSIFRKYGLKATFNLNSGLSDNDETRIKKREWKDVYSGFELASHTVTHPTLSRLPLSRVAEEILEDRKAIESITGSPVRGFAYPNGVYNPEIVSLLPFLGISYAYWQLTIKQKDFETLGVSCFEITLNDEQDDIKLESAYPISDEEGNNLVPYTFTITNTCDTYAYYQINLENLKEENDVKKLNETYIKASLDGNTPLLLTSYNQVAPTLEEAEKAYNLTSGVLAPTGAEGDKKTYELRLWMDYDTPPLPETMNAIFQSKISVVASYVEEETLQNNIVLSYESKTEGYSKVSETVEILGTSENYNIIEISEDGVIFTPVSPSKEIRVTKEYTKESNPTFYVRDEVGNIKKIDIVLEHLDQSGPEIIAIPQEEWGMK